MKRLIFILSFLFLFIFTSYASATIYKWVDEKGVVNFTDDYSKVPPDYHNKVEEVNIAKMGPLTPSQTPPGKITVSAQAVETANQAPPIAHPLVREGDFAVKLVEVLKLGTARNEAEAEDMLASAGIAPKNGWIADYPLTPDIIGELRRAIGVALDSGKLAMNKDEVLVAVQILIDNQWRMPVAPGEEQARQYGEYPPAPYSGYEGEYEPYNYPEPYYYPYPYYYGGYYYPYLYPYFGGSFVIRGFRGGGWGGRGFRGGGRGGRHGRF